MDKYYIRQLVIKNNRAIEYNLTIPNIDVFLHNKNKWDSYVHLTQLLIKLDFPLSVFI